MDGDNKTWMQKDAERDSRQEALRNARAEEARKKQLADAERERNRKRGEEVSRDKVEQVRADMAKRVAEAKAKAETLKDLRKRDTTIKPEEARKVTSLSDARTVGERNAAIQAVRSGTSPQQSVDAYRKLLRDGERVPLGLRQEGAAWRQQKLSDDSRDNGPKTTTTNTYSPSSDRPGPNESLPSGSVMMVHLWAGEAITDFFSLATGLGMDRWDGWALCDGQNGGPNMQGFFPVCADPDNDDYDVQGNGTNTNTQTGFTYHSLKHSHCIYLDPAPHEVAATAAASGVWAWDATDYAGGIDISEQVGCIAWSGFSSSDYQIPETVADLSGGGSVDFILDNRPKNYVIHFAVKL